MGEKCAITAQIFFLRSVEDSDQIRRQFLHNDCANYAANCTLIEGSIVFFLSLSLGGSLTRKR